MAGGSSRELARHSHGHCTRLPRHSRLLNRNLQSTVLSKRRHKPHARLVHLSPVLHAPHFRLVRCGFGKRKHATATPACLPAPCVFTYVLQTLKLQSLTSTTPDTNVAELSPGCDTRPRIWPLSPATRPGRHTCGSQSG